jgi:cell division protein FtsB
MHIIALVIIVYFLMVFLLLCRNGGKGLWKKLLLSLKEFTIIFFVTNLPFMMGAFLKQLQTPENQKFDYWLILLKEYSSGEAFIYVMGILAPIVYATIFKEHRFKGWLLSPMLLCAFLSLLIFSAMRAGNTIVNANLLNNMHVLLYISAITVWFLEILHQQIIASPPKGSFLNKGGLKIVEELSQNG